MIETVLSIGVAVLVIYVMMSDGKRESTKAYKPGDVRCLTCGITAAIDHCNCPTAADKAKWGL